MDTDEGTSVTGWRRSEAPKTRCTPISINSSIGICPTSLVCPVAGMAVAIDNTRATANRLFIGLLDDVGPGEGVEERPAPTQPPTILSKHPATLKRELLQA